MEMICQMLQGRVEQLRSKYGTARQEYECPPDRFYLQNGQDDYHDQQRDQLNPEIGLAAPGGDESLEGESKTAQQRLVLVKAHRPYCTAPEISVATTRSILD